MARGIAVEDEFGLAIDVAPDQPRGRTTVDSGARASDPGAPGVIFTTRFPRPRCAGAVGSLKPAHSILHSGAHGRVEKIDLSNLLQTPLKAQHACFGASLLFGPGEFLQIFFKCLVLLVSRLVD